MRRTSSRRVLSAVLAVVTLFGAPRTAHTQALDPLVTRDADAVTAKINAAAISPEMKTVLLAQIDKARADKEGATIQRQMIEKTRFTLENNVIVYGKLVTLVKSINATPDRPTSLKSRWVSLTEANLRLLPNDWRSVDGQVDHLKNEWQNWGTFMNTARTLQKTIAAGNATAPMKSYYTSLIEDQLSKLGPGSVDGENQVLQKYETAYSNDLLLLSNFDEMKKAVAAEAPATYPEFKANTVKEITAMRERVGYAAGGIGFTNYHAFRTSYAQRLDWVRQAAAIFTRTTGGDMATSMQNSVFRARLAIIVPGIVDYHSPLGVDPIGLAQLKRELDQRDAKKP